MKKPLLSAIVAVILAGAMSSLISCGNNPAQPAPVTIYVTATPQPAPGASVTWATNGSLGVGISGNHIFVGNYSTSLDVFTLTGAPVTTIGLGVYPVGFVADGSGGVYVNGSCNNVVKHIDSTFAVVGSFPTAHCANGLAADASGNFYITDAFGGSNLVQKYTGAGVSVTSWTVPGGNPWGIAIAGSPQTIYVSSSTLNAIYTFDLNGNILAKKWFIGNEGAALGIDGANRLYVSGYNTPSSMQCYSLDGTFLFQWGNFTSEGIAFDASNKIYIGSVGSLQVFTP